MEDNKEQFNNDGISNQTSKEEEQVSFQAPELEVAPSKKHLGIIIPVIGVFLVGIIAIVYILVTKASSKNPLALVREGYKNSVKAFEETEACKLFHDYYDNGSIEYKLALDEFLDEYVGISGLDADASMKLYYDVKNQKSALALGVDLAGDPLLDAILTFNKDAMVIGSDSLLDGKNYGIAYKNIAENFEKSYLAELLDEEMYNEILQILNHIDYEAVARGESLSNDFRKYSEEFMKALEKSIMKYAKISQGKGVLDYRSGDIATTKVMISMDDEAFCNIVVDMLIFIKEEGSFEDLFEQLIEILPEANSEYGMEDVLESFYSEIDKIKKDRKSAVNELLEEMKDFSLEITFSINKSKQLIGVEFDISYEDEDFSLAFIIGPDVKNNETITIVVENGVRIAIAWDVVEDSKDKYEAELTVKSFGQRIPLASLIADKKSGEYSFSMGSEANSLELSGTKSVNKEQVIYTIDEITIGADGDIENYNLGLDVIINKEDKMPDTSDYVEIFSLSEDDFTELYSYMEGIIQSLVMQLMSSMW